MNPNCTPSVVAVNEFAGTNNCGRDDHSRTEELGFLLGARSADLGPRLVENVGIGASNHCLRQGTPSSKATGGEVVDHRRSCRGNQLQQSLDEYNSSDIVSQFRAG